MFTILLLYSYCYYILKQIKEIKDKRSKPVGVEVAAASSSNKGKSCEPVFPGRFGLNYKDFAKEICSLNNNGANESFNYNDIPYCVEYRRDGNGNNEVLT